MRLSELTFWDKGIRLNTYTHTRNNSHYTKLGLVVSNPEVWDGELKQPMASCWGSSCESYLFCFIRQNRGRAHLAHLSAPNALRQGLEGPLGDHLAL